MASKIPGLQWRAGGPSENMGSGRLAGLLGQVIERLRQSMPVPNHTRLVQAHRLLESINEHPELLLTGGSDLLERVSAAHRTGWEFFLTMYARSLRQPFPTPFTEKRLAAFLEGSEREVPRGNTTPRDIQFESYVASMLILGGAEVTDAEPDLHLLFGRERVGLAAKRVTSLKRRKLEQRVGLAVDQIQNSGKRGFVVLNIDSRFIDIDPEMDRPLLLDEFDRRFDELNDLAEECARVPEVIGLISHGYAARWDFPATGEDRLPALRKTTPMRWVAFGETEEERNLFDEFSHGWASRIGNRFERIIAGEFV